MAYLKLINAEVLIKKHAVVHCKNCVIVLRPVSQQIWTPLKMAPPVQIGESISASEYGPMGVFIRYRIWTPLANLDPSHILSLQRIVF
jgi:hypothetical protein